jgi:hypothetical protein
MWRAYGGTAGVAMVLKGDFINSETAALGAFSSPVLYADKETFAREVEQIADIFTLEREFVAGLGRNQVRDLLFVMLQFGMLCTKHRGFHEEKEWRVIACPKLYASRLLRSEVEVVRNTPQKVLKLRLEDMPEHQLNLAPHSLIDRIIIGPCEFPLMLYQAFVQLLEEAGVHDADARVVTSSIPLRHIR